MLAFRSWAFCVLLLLLLSGYLRNASSESLFIRNVIEKVLKESDVVTLLYMNRRPNINCPLMEIDMDGFATLRLDQETTINIKEIFNNDVLSLVCMSELADVMLLSSLAQSLDRMREARIIILFHTRSSNLQEFLHAIAEQADNNNFINVIVLHSTFPEDKVPIVAYRLQPFPSPTFARIMVINEGQIFPKVRLNFQGKTAVVLPDLIPPRSMITTNPRTGQKSFGGSSTKLIMEFAKKNNIKLHYLRTPADSQPIEIQEVHKITRTGVLDLPIRALIQTLNPPPNLEYANAQFELSSSFIVVPCRYQMRIGDVFSGLRTYFTILLVSYLIFAIMETFIILTTNWILQRRPDTQHWNLVLNLRAFAGVLGLPMHLRRYRASISLQQIVMLMCICGLVFTSFFNANLSTLLTKHPHETEIKNFDQLYLDLSIIGNSKLAFK
ncbi:uncharacterized protein LOC115483335 [Drosophila hydei]|uniref:Uncharacterized protein LOC115483335 n=1 Tax=Drosophila hydei TaxID=7224 RepID=A0A6J2SWU9_DROHY|nr:uncharacterized protein LOC115483335 [Drosophila hydei]